MAELLISLDQGKLQGCTSITSNGYKYNCYLQIPYAKPPVGKLRFCDPKEPEPWNGVRDATKMGNSCSQVDYIFAKGFKGDEDSLHLNVYTPSNLSRDAKLPVMFWIHGGGFLTGSGDDEVYGPEYLIDKGVILVTINYRLGPIGFLCLHCPDIPGNAGLKDQVMALRWVQKNIHKFGGDNNNVTIFGESAGGASVCYHIVSPLSKNLFHRAIIQSGTCLSHWALQQDPEKNAFELLKLMGYDTQNKQEIVKIFKNISAKEITENSVNKFAIINTLGFTPAVEKEYANCEAFITSTPYEIIKSGKYNKVPCMIGVNSKEGLLRYIRDICDEIQITSLNEIDPYIFHLLPQKLRKLDLQKVQGIIEKIKQFYFHNNRNITENFLDVLRDFDFLIDISMFLNLLVKNKETVYFYNFAYNGEKNMFKNMCYLSYDTGACHADELAYLFNSKFDQSKFNEMDAVTSKRLTEMWTNFAKFGNPTPQLTDVITTMWEPFTEQSKTCLIIDKDLSKTSNLYHENIQFLENLEK